MASDVILYGATGYTGKLVAAELKRRKLSFTLAGRNRQKLERLAESLELDVPLKTASIDQPGSLLGIFKGGKVVINCAGPFSLIGEPVVRAAIESGCHYLDTTGEQAFVRKIVESYDRAASMAEVAVVNAMGFDYAPADCAASIAAQGLEPLDRLEISYDVKGMGASRGTMMSVLEVVGGDEAVFRNGHLHKAPIAVESESFDFPEPINRQRCVRLAAGEVITIPRHTDVRDLKVRISAGSVVPNALIQRAAPYIMPALSLFLRAAIARRALDKLIERAPEGPSEKARGDARFTIVIDAQSGKGKQRVTVHGRDIYGLTAIMAAQGAFLMSQPEFERSGVLSPASAFDPKGFLDYLAPFGLSY